MFSCQLSAFSLLPHQRRRDPSEAVHWTGWGNSRRLLLRWHMLHGVHILRSCLQLKAYARVVDVEGGGSWLVVFAEVVQQVPGYSGQ
eukprot:gene9521-1755_t